MTGLVTAALSGTGETSTGEAALFWVLAPVMVLAALGLLFARRAIHAAMCVVLVMVSLAFLYVAQDAPFLGIVQVVVYTGAVVPAAAAPVPVPHGGTAAGGAAGTGR